MDATHVVRGRTRPPLTAHSYFLTHRVVEECLLMCCIWVLGAAWGAVGEFDVDPFLVRTLDLRCRRSEALADCYSAFDLLTPSPLAVAFVSAND